MKILISKIMLSDRYILVPLATSILIAVVTFITFISAGALNRDNDKITAQLEEMKVLSEELVYIRNIVNSREKKIGLTKESGVVSSLEKIFESLGVKAKVIKPLSKNRIKDFTEDDAEVEIENLDLNLIVNLLHKLENSPAPLKIKNAVIKTTFENQDVLILKMTASLISK